MRGLITTVASALLLLASAALCAQETLSPSTYKQLNEIQGLLGEAKYPEAKAALDDLVDDLKPGFGLALTCELYGQYFLLQEKPNDALIWYRKSLAQDALTPVQEAGLATTTAQLMLSLDDTKGAVAELAPRLEKLLKQEESDSAKAKASGKAPSLVIPPLAFATLGSAYHLLADYHNSVLWTERAVSRARSKGEAVKEPWLQMLMAGYYQLKNYQRTAEVIDDLLRLNPEREDYWAQQASMYQLLEKPELALRSLELGYAGGYLKKPDSILFMVQLMIGQNLPERAGRILNKHLQDGTIELNERNWRLTAMAWQQGREREKAIGAMNQAAVFMEDGSLLLLSGQLAMQDGDFALALKQAEAAVAKGLKDKDQPKARMLAGSAALELKDLATARRYFQQGLSYADSASNARAWLDYIAALEEYGS
ncbi:hypothetical protein ACQUQU_06850 [Thalassolituus sp. LLYu03]|uniref:tetratricopeptide repeat protein n=1 Tax=Thalassolituus sp. LLYu03 TaxID=3421656 RepID=UPI003D2E017D